MTTDKNKYYLKTFKTNGDTQTTYTKKKRRISYKIQAVKKSEVHEYHLRVTYPSFVDCFNKKISPMNEGVYKDIEDLKHVWRCFIEK